MKTFQRGGRFLNEEINLIVFVGPVFKESPHISSHSPCYMSYKIFISSAKLKFDVY